MTTTDFYFSQPKRTIFWSYIFHIKIHNNYQANFPIKLSHQLSIFSTLGRQSYLPEQFRQISLYICSQYLSRLCFAFPDFFSRFYAARLSAAAELSNRSIHSQWLVQPGAKPAHFKDGRVQLPRTILNRRGGPDWIWFNFQMFASSLLYPVA